MLRPHAARGTSRRDNGPQRDHWPALPPAGHADDMAERIMLTIVFIVLTAFFAAMILVPHVPFLAGAD
jgi:hypothetical protein